ncbi:hypothetical protein COC69_32065 [Bacillus cereus]|uniref:Uncharacterized protein n=1 Tax=Bacillus cereus TaxID=1396 RepID=A0A9X7CH00_BACCE|nr:hypothetical protein [Bacillus cereus]PGS62694.1 hypothetical protein COC69_32065 [Bacillus cereus]
MDIKQYGKRETRLVEQVGIARMWDFNQMVLDVLEKEGLVKTHEILGDLASHAWETVVRHTQALESEKSPRK